MPTIVRETTPLGEASVGPSGRMRVHAITAGLGSSGYYSPDVIREAASKQLIKKGTPLFLDHASDTERLDRPERSVRDIAAVFTEAATYDDAAQALVGEIQVFAPYRDLLTEMAPHIGLSISGSATDVTEGEHNGRRVPVIEGLAAIDSVDWVTRAGRGGRVVELLESARGQAFTEETARLQLAEARNVGQWIESRLHLELTRIADDMFGDGRLTREERIQLSSAVGDALTAFVANLEAGAPALYQRDLWADPTALLAASESHNVPVARPGSTTTTEESQEDTMPNTQIEESELARLRETAGRVTALEAERDTAVQERDQSRTQLAETRRAGRAREIVTERAGEHQVEFTALEQRGLMAGLPVTEAGELDETAFLTTVNEAATAALEARGAGRVTGFGGKATETTAITEADIDTAVGSAFGRQVKEA